MKITRWTAGGKPTITEQTLDDELRVVHTETRIPARTPHVFQRRDDGVFCLTCHGQRTDTWSDMTSHCVGRPLTPYESGMIQNGYWDYKNSEWVVS